MNRTRTATALLTAAACATLIVGTAEADTPTDPGTTSGTSTGAGTNKSTKKITGIKKDEKTDNKSDTRSILHAFASGDFSEVSTPKTITFALGVVTAVLNLALQLDEQQVKAVANQFNVQMPQMPQLQMPQLPNAANVQSQIDASINQVRAQLHI